MKTEKNNNIRIITEINYTIYITSEVEERNGIGLLIDYDPREFVHM